MGHRHGNIGERRADERGPGLARGESPAPEYKEPRSDPRCTEECTSAEGWAPRKSTLSMRQWRIPRPPVHLERGTGWRTAASEKRQGSSKRQKTWDLLYRVVWAPSTQVRPRDSRAQRGRRPGESPRQEQSPPVVLKRFPKGRRRPEIFSTRAVPTPKPHKSAIEAQPIHMHTCTLFSLHPLSKTALLPLPAKPTQNTHHPTRSMSKARGWWCLLLTGALNHSAGGGGGVETTPVTAQIKRPEIFLCL